MSSTSIRKGSISDKLAPLAVGESVYIETEHRKYAVIQRQVTTPERLAGHLKERTFSSKMFVAVSTISSADVRCLVCVKRVS